MDAAQLVITIMASGGGGAALLAMINGLWKWINGSASRERSKNTDLNNQRVNAIKERDQALDERDLADRRKRDAYEYASALRRQLRENGIVPNAWFAKDIEPFEDTVPKEFKE